MFMYTTEDVPMLHSVNFASLHSPRSGFMLNKRPYTKLKHSAYRK
ncbi:hypothetical protein QSI_1177 [Clostridioides difficile P28]|nr:hypothetical protein QSI_1177 [Clostridioides difficile P28]